jgi:hypothetical protein
MNRSYTAVFIGAVWTLPVRLDVLRFIGESNWRRRLLSEGRGSKNPVLYYEPVSRRLVEQIISFMKQLFFFHVTTIFFHVTTIFFQVTAIFFMFLLKSSFF